MKKRILIIVAVIVIAIITWCILFTLLSRRVDNATRQGFINDCEAFLLSDETFIENYGTLVSINSDDEMPTQISNGEYNKYYMNFTCTTQKGEFNIRVHLAYDNGWVFSYEELN